MAMSDFEKQLKQFAPEKPSTDVSELFFQCGWNAREAANATIAVSGPADKKSVRRQVRTFLVGMACGLMASFATFLWQPSMSSTPTIVKTEHSVEDASTTLTANEPKIELIDVSESTISGEMKTESSSWQVQDLFAADQLTVSNNSPLSLAARECWRQQLQSVPSPSADESAAIDMFSDDTKILRAGPMNKKLLEELFL